MFHVEKLGAAGEPVTAAELRDHLRLNDTAEDGLLSEFLASAVELFEHDTGRPVLTGEYKQYLSAWPCGPIVLGRGGVTAVNSVSAYDAAGVEQPLATDQWRAELLTPPARVYLASTPATVTTAAGIPVSPVGVVFFRAGWPTVNAVPRQVRVALKLLAGHWYANREAYTERKLDAVAAGWARVVSRFKLGITGPWGQ